MSQKKKNIARRGALPRVLRRLKHYRLALLISLLLSALTVALTLYVWLTSTVFFRFAFKSVSAR